MAVLTRSISGINSPWGGIIEVIASLSHCYFPYVEKKHPKIRDKNEYILSRWKKISSLIIVLTISLRLCPRLCR